MKNKNAIVIGSGIAGLSAAAYLAKSGYQVHIFEKNEQAGGRARQFTANGFVFDMGPSWYWMPDVFEKFYQDFGHTTADFYELVRLDPSYRVIDKNGQLVDIPADMQELEDLFDKYEKGAGLKLRQFLKEAAYKYEVGINDLVYKPGLSLLEFADFRLLKGLLKMDVLNNMRSHVRSFIKHPFLQELLEFPVLFLGALPENTPALYSLMNYADMSLGTWYPMGGMHKIIEAFVQIAQQQGVHIHLNTAVSSILVENGKAIGVQTNQGKFLADVVVGAADYHHVESNLLEAPYRQYTEQYWDKRKMAPSCLLYYIGLNKRIPNMRHHTLFFDTDFELHSQEIYTHPQWPKNPLFYASAPSVTDPSVAPEGHENLFLLIPVAPGLTGDDEATREKYLQLMLQRMEQKLGVQIADHVVYKKSYSIQNFIADYNAFKGNAYGLANTLSQTAVLKPRLKHKKVKGLYFAGQLTVPGPGVPPSIISGKVCATQILKDFKTKA
jgi:phytoene desaturase